MATDFEHLSDWGKDAYIDISAKMISAGIPSDKFEDGVLRKSISLGQWLIKELEMKEAHLGAATAPDCTVFIQPGGNESNTWKLVWLVPADRVSWTSSPKSQYVQHSISNFPGPQLIVVAENPKHSKLVITQIR